MVEIGCNPPWASGATSAIKKKLTRMPDAMVLELGSGSSTIFLAGLCGGLIVLDQDQIKLEAIRRALKQKNIDDNVQLIVAERSIVESENNFSSYIFDLVIIGDDFHKLDIIGIHGSVRPGGTLVLHESQRNVGTPAFTDLAGWTRTTHIDEERQTTVWQKPTGRATDLENATAHTVEHAGYREVIFALSGYASLGADGRPYDALVTSEARSCFEARLVERKKIPARGFISSPRIYEIKRGAVCRLGPKKFVFDQDRNIIKEASLGLSTNELTNIAPIPDTAFRKTGTCVDLTAPGAALFSFFLFDSLAKIGILERARLNLDEVDIFFVNSLTRFTRSALGRFGIHSNRIQARGTDSYLGISAENLIVVGPVRRTRFTPVWAKNFIVDLFLSSKFLSMPQDRRIFISRQKSKGRRIVNYPEISTILQKFSIDILFAEDIEISQMAGIAQLSSMIIGTHGAGLANIIFARPETKIIELTGAHYTPQFKLLAEICNLNYHTLECTNEDGVKLLDFPELDQKQAETHNRDNIIVPADALHDLISELTRNNE